MSLLIKALANAEKDKQAEHNKKQQSEALSLELTPKNTTAQPRAIDDESHIAAQQAEEFLSLEEEAGLGVIPVIPAKKTELGLEKSLPEKALTSSPNHQHQTQPPLHKKVEAKPAERAIYASQPEIHAEDTNQKAAAKVFVANQSAKAPSSVGALLLLGVGGALVVLLGMKGYAYLNKPVPVLVQPVAPANLPTVAAVQSAVITEPDNTPVVNEVVKPPVADLESNKQAEVLDQVSGKQAASDVKVENEAFATPTTQQKRGTRVEKNIETAVVSEEVIDAPRETSRQSVRHAEKQTPLKLSSKASTATVDPTLLAAYQAFNRGEDASAQQQYREVLKRDVRNVDALLGMAAIAQRQGRDADAAGWYQKVLDVEPQNSIAQSAMASPQASADATSAESRIKSMLALQPEAAHLHAALGNIYAEQNQWTSAQNAYFEASRYEPNNADYVFNVAVSLEHMGKKNLALLQYQRALALLNQSGGASPDRAILEARIQALQ